MRARHLRTIIIAAVASCALALTGCAPAAPAGPDPLTEVQVTGAVGEAPVVTIGDLSGLGNEVVRQVLVEGDGPRTTAETFIDPELAIYDGASKQAEVPFQPLGQIIQSSDPQLPQFFSDIFVDVPAGSRVLVIVPGSVLLAQTGQAVAPGATPTAPAVIVADVHAVPELAAWGAPQPPTQDLVTVTDGDGGAPIVTIAAGAPEPSELVLDVRKLGDGAVVAEGDRVFLQYRGVLFATGAEFDSSWSRGTPSQFATTDVVPGFAQALVGQTVGSQVVAIIPPALAYGDQASSSIPAGSTLVFVVDILAIA